MTLAKSEFGILVLVHHGIQTMWLLVTAVCFFIRVL
jgi:hypothetical protein